MCNLLYYKSLAKYSCILLNEKLVCEIDNIYGGFELTFNDPSQDS